MEKTAKQMFEELGWKCVTKCYDLVVYEYNGVYRYKNEQPLEDWTKKCIMKFYNHSKRIEFEEHINNDELGGMYNQLEPSIYYKELQALNKQVEELGWGKEEENV